MIRGEPANRKVCPGYGFRAVPECRNDISVRKQRPVTPCKNTIFALLRKLSDLLML